ncbi:MAG: helix-turn-helix domain-containing protein [Pseudomonadota bacterium]
MSIDRHISETERELRGVIGDDATDRLMDRCGGTTVYVAETPEGTKLADIVGADMAEAMRDYFGRGHVLVPSGGRVQELRRERALDLLRQGMSAEHVARECQVSARTIYMYQRRFRKQGLIAANPRQLKLPGLD